MRRIAVATYAELLDPAHFARQYTFLPPAADLRPYVACYWQLDLRAPHWATQEFRELLFASLHASLVVNLGTAFEVTGVTGQPVLPCTRSVCVSQQAQALTYRHAHGNFLVGIKFRPAALPRVFGLRAAEWPTALAPAEALLPGMADLEERLRADASPPAMQRELDALVRQAVGRVPDLRLATVCRACHPDLLAQARYRLADLAAVLCLTPRTLERYFTYTLGLPPKLCLRIARFRQALPHYARHGTRAAYEDLGYTDFPHFLRDYRRFGPPGRQPAG